MSFHAILSPSGASRWLACTPSARLETEFPNTSGTAASEGTLAHKLAEAILRHTHKMITTGVFHKTLKSIKEDELYTDAMYEYAQNYADYVMEKLAGAQVNTSDAMLFLETLFDLTAYVPDGFGTGDAVIIADHILEIIDLKYGKGVPVFADNNSQMMLYALGALLAFGLLYDVQIVRMTIYQPRIDNISTWEISVADLKQWAEEVLRPRAELAFKGEGEFNPGKHCRFCRAKAVCRANMDYNMEMAKYDFKDGVLLTESEIADILDKEDEFTKWISGIKKYALAEAVNNHRSFPGYKLVEGRSNRRYIDQEAVIAQLKTDGIPDDKIYEPKEIIGITKMEKMLGKAAFNVLIGPLTAKSPGAPTLVPVSDKRSEYSSAANAIKDFEDIDIED